MTTIKRTRTTLLCMTLSLFISTAFGGPTQSPAAGNAPTTAPAAQSSRQLCLQLAAQCELLRAENIRLKQELAQIQTTLKQRSQKPMPAESIPNDWRQEQINGMTFYLVPVAKPE